MKKANLLIIAFVLLCVAIPAAGQSGGRFEEAKRMGMAFIQSEQFDKASGRLEEIWEQDQSDLTVGEYLAVAYLNTEDRRALPRLKQQAFEIIGKLAASRARVTFLVLHSHEKLAWLQGREMNQFCRGRLSIVDRHLIYVASKGEKASEHSFDVTPTAFKGIALHKDDTRGTFDLKLAQGNFFFATRNRNRDEAIVIVDLANRQLGFK